METIKVCHPDLADEFMVINAADFNPNLHRLFTEPEPESSDTEAAKKAKGKKKPPTVNAALLAQLKPNGEGEGEGDPGEQGDLELDETTTD